MIGHDVGESCTMREASVVYPILGICCRLSIDLEIFSIYVFEMLPRTALKVLW
jgi:hypothetical protein